VIDNYAIRELIWITEQRFLYGESMWDPIREGTLPGEDKKQGEQAADE
jgi:hypothetical protein